MWSLRVTRLAALVCQMDAEMMDWNGVLGMDLLQAKAAADVYGKQQLSEDAFYDQHGCEWLLFVRLFLRKFRQPSIVAHRRSKGEAIPIESQ